MVKRAWDPKKKKYVMKEQVKPEKVFITKSSLIMKNGIVIGKKSNGTYVKPKESIEGVEPNKPRRVK